MRPFTLLTAALLAGTGAAQAGDFQNCTRGEDVRTVEIVAPGIVGAACDLRYVREHGANVSVPYHADFSVEFCSERAAALVASLTAAGFVCEASKVLRDAAIETEPPRTAGDVDTSSGEAVAAAGDAPAADNPYPDAPTVADLSDANGVPESASVGAESAIAAGQTALAQPGPAGQDVQALPGEETLLGAADEFAESSMAIASRGPTALAPTLAATPAVGRPSRASVVGRLVGAAPDAAPIAQPVSDAAGEERLVPAASDTPSPDGQRGATVAASAIAAGGRPAADIIRGVLAAQAAAWNEGDLEAFMGGYWKSPQVRFVSGTSVSKGWTQTLRKYRERYGDGASLGRLSFDALEIEMIADDVAVIVGRFSLAGNDKPEAGTFTLVMKRFDGLWRIVHDHSVADAAPTE